MILTDEEVDSRLASPSNLMNRIEQRSNAKSVEVLPMTGNGNLAGRKQGTIPSRVRDLLGVIANVSDETQDSIADTFGVSQESVSNFSNGLVVERVDEGLKEKIASARANIRGEDSTDIAHQAALDVMVASLTSLKDKLPDVDKAKDLARIASDMSKITSNLKGKDKPGDTNNTQVIIYAPSQRNEGNYESITA